VRFANRHPVPVSNRDGDRNCVGHSDTMPVGLSDSDGDRNRVSDGDGDGDTSCLACRMPDAHRGSHTHPDAYAYANCDPHTNTHTHGNSNALSDSDCHAHGVSDRATLPVRGCDTGSTARRAVL
jgi:hypothetical protein